MYARAIEDAGTRLHELRREELDELGLAALTLVLSVVAAWVYPPLAIPLLVGGVVLAGLGVRALWRRWDLVERLAGERDAYVIPAVLDYASREVTIERRRSFAAVIRHVLGSAAVPDARAAEELAALACELEDDGLVLDPACGVACQRLLSDVVESQLPNDDLRAGELRSRLRQIRSGFVAPPPDGT